MQPERWGLTRLLKMVKMETKPTRRRRNVKTRKILELWGETLKLSVKKEHMCRSRSLDECWSCSSSSARWLSGMRGEESPVSHFIGELEARLPREEECRSSTMLRFAMKWVLSFSFYDLISNKCLGLTLSRGERTVFLLWLSPMWIQIHLFAQFIIFFSTTSKATTLCYCIL